MEFEKYVPPNQGHSNYIEESPKNDSETITVPLYQNDVILPEFKPKYSIFINRSSFVDTPQAIKIVNNFGPYQGVVSKKISLKILDCSLSLYRNKEDF